MREFEKLAQHLFICAPSVAPPAALACFFPSTLKILEQRRIEFQRRRDYLVPALERAGLAVPAWPTGAFYVYAACPGRSAAGRRVALGLLERQGGAAPRKVYCGEVCPGKAWRRKNQAARRNRASICARRARSASTLNA